MSANAENFETSKKIIIKIGSALLIDSKSGVFNSNWLNNLVDQVVELKKKGKDVIIVTSGAIPLGASILGMNHLKIKLIEKQIASVAGQMELMNHFKESFFRHSLNIAQVLLTIEDIENRKKFASAKKIIDGLLAKNIVPVINENDLVANAEIRFGDNDRLSARVAQTINADLLVLFSNEDGLYSSNPRLDNNAHFIKEVYEINSDIEKMAGDSLQGTGGMSAKVAAAKIAMHHADCKVVIANGLSNNPLKDLINGAKSTWFFDNKESHLKYLK